MKIHEFVPNRTLISEGVVEPNALLSIRNVLRDGGKNPNTFQFLVMARFLQLLKAGTFYRESNPVFEPNMTTSKEMLDLLRAMSPDELTQVAAKLLDVLSLKDADKFALLCNPAQEYATWLRWVTAREAND